MNQHKIIANFTNIFRAACAYRQFLMVLLIFVPHCNIILIYNVILIYMTVIYSEEENQ